MVVGGPLNSSSWSFLLTNILQRKLPCGIYWNPAAYLSYKSQNKLSKGAKINVNVVTSQKLVFTQRLSGWTGCIWISCGQRQACARPLMWTAGSYRFETPLVSTGTDQGQNPAPELLGGTARFRCTTLRCSCRWNRGWGMIFWILENCHWDSLDPLSWINQWYFWCLHQFQLIKVIFFPNPSVAQLLRVVFSPVAW